MRVQPNTLESSNNTVLSELYIEKLKAFCPLVMHVCEKLHQMVRAAKVCIQFDVIYILDCMCSQYSLHTLCAHTCMRTCCVTKDMEMTYLYISLITSLIVF